MEMEEKREMISKKTAENGKNPPIAIKNFD
jgi:hypothetical protein